MNPEQRADQRDVLAERSGRGDSAQTGQASASQNVVQHGFRLIVGRVPDGDEPAVMLGGGSCQKFIAGAPGGLLRGAGGESFFLRVEAFHMAVHFKRPGKSLDPNRVRVRFCAAPAVVEVGHDELHIQIRLQPMQPAQKCDAVAASGNGHEDSRRGDAEQFRGLLNLRRRFAVVLRVVCHAAFLVAGAFSV